VRLRTGGTFPRELAVHLIARNEGARAARLLAEDCSFTVRLYRSATALTRGTEPAWENRPVVTNTGSSRVSPECDLMDLSLTVPPRETRSRLVASVPLESLERSLLTGRYLVALGYRDSANSPVRLVRAGCIVLDRRHGSSVSLSGPTCAEWNPKEREAELHRATREPFAPRASDGAYLEFQVERRAAPLAENSPVPYLAPLRTAGITDTVLVQFVVDSAGRVSPGTVKVLRARYQAAADVVRAAVLAWRFIPAERRGQPVKQLVQTAVPVVP
jgi:hypothetical protein